MTVETKEKKLKVEFDEAVHGDELKRLIKDASNHKLMMSGFADKIKDERTAAKEKLGVEGKVFNQLLAIYHKSTRDAYENEKDEIVELYDSIFPSK